MGMEAPLGMAFSGMDGRFLPTNNILINIWIIMIGWLFSGSYNSCFCVRCLLCFFVSCCLMSKNGMTNTGKPNGEGCIHHLVAGSGRLVMSFLLCF
jgi:hypothetical protein